MIPPDDAPDDRLLPDEVDEVVESAHNVFLKLPPPMAADLGIVAGVLMTHPRKGAREDALARLSRVAHMVFHFLDDDDDDDGGGDEGGGPDPEDGIRLPGTGKANGSKIMVPN